MKNNSPYNIPAKTLFRLCADSIERTSKFAMAKFNAFIKEGIKMTSTIHGLMPEPIPCAYSPMKGKELDAMGALGIARDAGRPKTSQILDFCKKFTP